MVTNYPQQLAATESIQADAPDVSVVSRVASRLNQTLCGLSGHDAARALGGQARHDALHQLRP